MTMVIVMPTYPEGGNHALKCLKVCQHHHQQVVRVSCESATFSGCQRLKEHVARDCYNGRFG